MQLVFATHNKHKVSEISPLLPPAITLIEADEIGCTGEIPETGDTLAANALQKAMFIYDKYGYDCFADDTGLEVQYLGGRPGVFSARYAGEGKSAEENIQKLLSEMKDAKDRTAVFKTIIALVIKGKPFFFEGSVKGHIALERMGNSGFGYDPVFVPEGSTRSFAQMTLAEKNTQSHRAMAVKNFVEYLKK